MGVNSSRWGANDGRRHPASLYYRSNALRTCRARVSGPARARRARGQAHPCLGASRVGLVPGPRTWVQAPLDVVNSREGHVRDVGRVRVQGRRRRGRGEQPEDSAASRARPAVPAAVLVPAPPSARVFARPALAGGQRHAGSRRRAAPRREQRSASCRRAPPRCGAPRAPLPMGERSLGAAAPGAGMTWTRRSSFTRRRSGSSPTTRTCSTRRARSACRPGAPRMRSGCSRAA